VCWASRIQTVNSYSYKSIHETPAILLRNQFSFWIKSGSGFGNCTIAPVLKRFTSAGQASSFACMAKDRPTLCSRNIGKAEVEAFLTMLTAALNSRTGYQTQTRKKRPAATRVHGLRVQVRDEGSCGLRHMFTEPNRPSAHVNRAQAAMK
jgi:hypothetical protein